MIFEAGVVSRVELAASQGIADAESLHVSLDTHQLSADVVIFGNLTSDGRLFQKVRAEMRNVRTAVLVLVGGKLSRVEFDDRGVRTVLCISLICSTFVSTLNLLQSIRLFIHLISYHFSVY